MPGGCPFCGKLTPEYDTAKTEEEMARIIGMHLAVCPAFVTPPKVIGP